MLAAVYGLVCYLLVVTCYFVFISIVSGSVFQEAWGYAGVANCHFCCFLLFLLFVGCYLGEKFDRNGACFIRRGVVVGGGFRAPRTACRLESVALGLAWCLAPVCGLGIYRLLGLLLDSHIALAADPSYKSPPLPSLEWTCFLLPLNW